MAYIQMRTKSNIWMELNFDPDSVIALHYHSQKTPISSGIPNTLQNGNCPDKFHMGWIENGKPQLKTIWETLQRENYC